MKKSFPGSISVRVAAVAMVIALAATLGFSQYNDNYQINAVQQQVRLRIISDNRGSNEAVVFDNNAIVVPAQSGRLNRVAGSGRYRSNNSSWRVFNYEGQFDARNGQLSNVRYAWSTDNGQGSPSLGNGKISWAGRVDGTARITIRGRNVSAREISTRTPISEVDSRVNEALPRQAVTVSVSKRDGRGRVVVFQQPNNSNNFTAILEIDDPSAGSDYYSLDVDWNNDGGDRPPLGNGNISWAGRIDATAQITIRDGRVTARETSTRVPISEITSNVKQALPRRAVRVSVNKLSGRGEVFVSQQPSSSNNFTSIIQINDSDSGSDYYSIDVEWNEGGGYRPPLGQGPGGSRQMYWEGSVDGEIEVSVQRRNATYRVINGRNPTGIRADFDGQLPRSEVQVSVRKIRGRGDVEVITQPESYNNYTAVIRIRDPRGGADAYAFELDWDRNAVDEGGGGGFAQLTWQGRVDDVVRLEIRGRNVRGYALSGQRLSNERFDFNQPLPNRDVNVNVERRDGRGDVRVIQQPNRFNNYTAIIEIRDTSGGADNYNLDISW